jgi:SAM-dependent methyltransferase
MQWKIKNLAFKILAVAPGGKRLHSLGQALITGRRRMVIGKSLRTYSHHVEEMDKHGGVEGKTIMEFGSGRNLIAVLLLSAAGAERVYAFDIERLATTELVNDAIAQARELGLPWVGSNPWPAISDIDTDLQAKYRIFYRAPGDAAKTGLPDQSIDWVCSTATLEHIPPTAITSIMTEARRILKPGAHSSMIIDYHDHYSSTDKSISPYNFYQYSDREWNRYNPRMHYVNRLRHSDFVSIFDRVGFDIKECRAMTPPDSADLLSKIRISEDFNKYDAADLAITTGVFLLVSRPS